MAINWEKVAAQAKRSEGTVRETRGTVQREPSPVSTSPVLAPLLKKDGGASISAAAPVARGSTYLTGGAATPAPSYGAGAQARELKELDIKPKEKKTPAAPQPAQTPAWQGLMDLSAAELERRHEAAKAERDALSGQVAREETLDVAGSYAAVSGRYKARETNPIPSVAAASGTWVSEEDKRLAPLRADARRKQDEVNDLAAAHYHRKNQEQFAKLETDAASQTKFSAAQALTTDLDTISKALSAPTAYNGQDTRFKSDGEAVLRKYGADDLQDLQRALTARKEGLVKELEAKGYDFETMAGYDRMLRQQENSIQTQEKAKEDAEESPVLMSGLSTVLSPLQGLDFVRTGLNGVGHSNADDLGSYVPANVYDMYATNMVQTIRGTVSQKIAENTDWELFGQNVGAFLYNTGMSMADSALLVATLGPGSTYLMGLSSAANKSKEIIEQGGSNEQAFWGGAAAGVAEYVFEKFSVDNLLKPKEIASWKSMVKEALKQGGIEASEEMLTECANIISDAMVMGERSGMATAIKEYQEQGMTEDKALLQACLDNIGQVAVAGVGGFLSGVGMGGGKIAIEQGGQTAYNAIFDRLTKRGGETTHVDTQQADGARVDAQTGVDTPAAQNGVEGLETQKAATDGVAGLNPVSEEMQESLATGKNNFIAKTLGDIVDFAKRALQKKGGPERLYMGTLPDATAEFIKQQTGVDVSGYQTILPGDSIQHIRKHHGDPVMEGARGQRAVSVEDIGHLADILSQPDSVSLAEGTEAGGRRVLLFSKQIGDVYYTAQAVTDSRQALTTKTMWIKRGKPTDTMPNASASADPVLNAQSAPPSGFPTDSIPQTAQDVKPETGDGMENSVGAAARGFAGSYDRLQGESGQFHPDGESRARQVDVPVHDFAGKNIPKSAATAMEAEVTPDSAVGMIQEAIANGTFSFERNTDEGAKGRARATVEENGWEGALALWKSEVSKGKVSKDLVALGQLLLNNAMNATDVNSKVVIDILTGYTAMSTTAAQSLQAQRILKKLSPEGKLYACQKTLKAFQNDLNNRLGDKAPTITVDETLYQAFLDAGTDTEAQNEALQAIYQSVADQIPSRFIDKWNAWRYLSMLGNPRTHIRNVGGNAAFAPVRGVKNALAWGMENAVNLVNKAAGGDGITKTKGVILPILSRLNQGDGALVSACYQDIANVEAQLLGEGKYGQTAAGQIDQMRTIFKLKPLEAVREFNGAALDIEDTWFSRPAYAGALAGYLKANGITAQMMADGTVDTKVMTDARAYAIREAQKATYRDANALSDFIANFGYKGKNKVGKAANTLLEGVLPFKRTPANILARGLEYSPAGLVKGLTADLIQVSKGNMTAATAIDNIASGLTGTGLLAVGAWLASVGLVSGGGGDDEKDRLDDLTGGQDYALNLPGGYNVTLDWLAPEALPFFMGVELFNAMSDNKDGGITLENIEDAVMKVTDPLMEMSMLQSLQDAIETVRFDNSGTLLRVAANAGVSYLSQGVPTLFGQIERTAENERETTFTDKTSGVPKNIQYLLGKTLNKTPGEFQQIPYIDAWGRHEETGSPLIRALNNFTNPAYVSKNNETEADKEIRRLLDVGQTGVTPKRPSQSEKICDEYLTAEEYVTYAETKGQLSYRLVSELIESGAYKAMGDADKAKAISDALSCATALAKKKVKPQYKLATKWESAYKAYVR